MPSDQAPPLVSVVIRAKNEEKRLPRCLGMILAQAACSPREILVIDSGSTDGTVAIARKFPGVSVREIAPATFNYGETLNEGIRLARGRYVVALSAHCVPADGHWLERLVEPLERDPAVAGAFGRQVPWPGCEPVERYFLELLYQDRDYVVDASALSDDPLGILFSNASACVRRDVALAVPFRPLPWAEDRAWAHAVLRAGHKLAYASRSAVLHSHQRTLSGWYRVGCLHGKAMARVGSPALALRSQEWFGIGKLWSALRYWQAVCAKQGVAPSGEVRAAVGSVCRVIAFDFGRWSGQRRAGGPAPDPPAVAVDRGVYSTA
jgi:rhamnosyltransferase